MNEKIELKHLHINDERLFSYPLISPALVDSIKKVGLINPLLVQPRLSGEFEVICGHRRLAACRELNFKEVNCFILEQPIEVLDVLLLNLHDNKSSRSFNPVEQSIIINQLEKFINPQEVIAVYMPLLGLSPHAKIRNKLIPLAKLDDAIKMAIVNGSLHPDTAYRLSCLDVMDCTAIFELLKNVHLSASKQMEIIANLETVSLRESISIQGIMKNLGLAVIIENPETPLNQKGELVRELLHKRAFPLYSQAQADFMENKRKLKIPPRIDLTPPPYFEGEDYKLSLSFKSPEELKKHLNKLTEMMDNPALLEIFKVGKKL